MATAVEGGVNVSVADGDPTRFSSLYEEIIERQASRRSVSRARDNYDDAVDDAAATTPPPAPRGHSNGSGHSGREIDSAGSPPGTRKSLASASEAELGRLEPTERSQRLESLRALGDAPPRSGLSHAEAAGSEGRRSAAGVAANGAGSSAGTPPMPAPLITKRTTPLLSRASAATGRPDSNGYASPGAPVVGERRPGESRSSAAPSGGGGRRSYDFQEALRVDDLAAKVETLTKVLGEREAENVALSTKVESLQEENEKLRLRHTTSTTIGLMDDSEAEIRKYQQKIELLVAEKEILSKELSDAKEEINLLTKDPELAKSAKPLTKSLEFDRNNPATLRRKVEDLETQIQDLQEANESTAMLLANYKPTLSEAGPLLNSNVSGHLSLDHSTLLETMDKSRGRLANSDAESLRREIESLRSDLMGLRQRNELVCAENERLRAYEKVPGRVKSTTHGMTDLQRYEREHDSVLEEMERLRNQLVEEQNKSSRVGGTHLRSKSYANLSSYENEYRSPYFERRTAAKPEGERSPRKTSTGAEPRPSSSLRIANTEFRESRGSAREKSSKSPLHQLADERGEVQSSGSTSSILSDAERELEDMRIISSRSFSRTHQTEKEKSENSLVRRSGTSTLQQSQSGSLRSISPPPIPTQHNRIALMKSGYNPDVERESVFATINRHPFAPRNAADIQLRDIVKFTRQGGRICKGLVHFVGHLPGRNDVYIGVELEHEDGKHDGTYEGRRYFQCKTNKGVFVAFNKVIMCYGLRPV